MTPYTTHKAPEWESTDASQLRDLLNSDTFKKALYYLHAGKPTLLDGGDVNKTLVRSGEVKGFEEVLSNLFLLTSEPPKVGGPVENYPNLDDESQWSQDNKPKQP